MRIQVEIDTDEQIVEICHDKFFFFFQKDVSFFFDLILDKFVFYEWKENLFKNDRTHVSDRWQRCREIVLKKRNKRQTIFCRVFYFYAINVVIHLHSGAHEVM
jgi:hypothetical protein